MGEIARVVQSERCAGCGICAGIFETPAAEMQLSRLGFLRPREIRKMDEGERKLFAQVCPGETVGHSHIDDSFTTYWGPVTGVYTGYAVDPETRFRGSSGGGLSALAIHLLESGSVVGVVHIAPSDHSPFENVAQVSRNRADVLRAAGSRYAPASPLTRLNEYLREPGEFAFIGKPCDVAALKALARIRSDVARKFPYMLSFMCAGTPSMKGTAEVVEALGFDPDEIVRFRYRGNGWPGKARAETKDGRAEEMDYDRSWGTILNRHLQFRCKICPDGTGEFADITCADAWYGDERGYPVFGETDGRSLFLARNRLGSALLDRAVKAKAITVETIAQEDIMRIQPYQAERKRAVIARLLGVRMALRMTPRYVNMGLLRASKTATFKIHARNAIGTWMRAVKLKKRG